MYDDVDETIVTGYRLRVRNEGDNPGDSPRDDESNLGTLVLKHGRYDLPFEGDLAGRIDEALQNYGFRTVERWLRVCHGATVVLPVRGYDHGQFRLEAAERPSYPFNDVWDSGLAGLIYDTPQGREECGTPAELIAEVLAAEVKVYDQWANGEVYGYVVEQHEGNGGDDWEIVDSCGGYYDEDDATSEGEAALRAAVEAAVPAEPPLLTDQHITALVDKVKANGEGDPFTRYDLELYPDDFATVLHALRDYDGDRREQVRALVTGIARSLGVDLG